MTAAFPPVGGRFVGQSVQRKEDVRLLTGKGTFVDDVKLPNLVHATFVRSDVARARILRLDVEDARRAPGVIAVLTAAELNGRLAGTMLPSLYVGVPVKVSPIRPLAVDDVRFVGDLVALVIAVDRYVAEDAAELVEIEYETLVPVVDYEQAAAHAERVHVEEPSNVAAFATSPPDPGVEAAFRDAATVVSATFRQHRYSHVPMETRGVVARFDRHEQRLDVWVSSQNPHEVRSACSRITGVPEHGVRVRSGDVGGGFGQKSFLGREEQVIVLAAHLLGLPVKWIEDRRENLVAGTHARVARAEVTMATAHDGTILAADVKHLEDIGSYAPGGGSAHTSVCLRFPFPYRVPLMSWSSQVVWTNTCGRSAYRAPWQMEAVAREQMLDVVARRLGIDPLDLRRRNVLTAGDLPYKTATGIVIEHVTPQETLEAAATAIGYDSFRAQQAAARAEGRYLGVGICVYIEPQTTVATYKTEAARMRIGPSGHVDVYLGSGAHGQGLETTTAQVTAEFLGVDVDDITVHQGDTESTPFGPGTGGSRSGPMIGAVIQQAAGVLRGRVFAIAAHLLEASEDDLLIEAGNISVAGSPGKGLTLAQIARKAHHEAASLPAVLDVNLETVERFTAPPTMYSNACHMATVAVDPGTGVVTILRYVVAEDCGQMINPAIVEGQIAGGVAQGIGGVLYEENSYDADGNPLATTLMDYLLPTASDVPNIEYVHLESPGSTPGAYKGVGEGGAIGAPPAIFNAVADALSPLGVDLRDQPLFPGRVRDLVLAAKNRGAA